MNYEITDLKEWVSIFRTGKQHILQTLITFLLQNFLKRHTVKSLNTILGYYLLGFK